MVASRYEGASGLSESSFIWRQRSAYPEHGLSGGSAESIGYLEYLGVARAVGHVHVRLDWDDSELNSDEEAEGSV